MDEVWKDKAIKYFIDAYSFSMNLAKDTVSSWEDEDIDGLTAEEAVEEEMSCWGEG